MAFLLGSFADGLFAGSKAMSGMLDTAEQIKNRRALTGAEVERMSAETEAQRQMTKAAGDAGAAASAVTGAAGGDATTAPTRARGPIGGSSGGVIGGGAVAPTDRTRARWQPGQPAAVPAGGATAPATTAAKPATTPTAGGAAASAPAASAPEQALPVGRTDAPNYLPNQLSQAGSVPNPANPTTTPIQPQRQAIAMPTLASSQVGMGPTVQANMNPTTGQNA